MESYMLCNNSSAAVSTYVRYAVALNELWTQHRVEPTALEFADRLRIPPNRAKVALLRLQQRGFARRRKDPKAATTKHPYRYRPSKRSLREGRFWSHDPDVADETHQIELYHRLEDLVDAGRHDEAMTYYVTRRNAWGHGFWRTAAQGLLVRSFRTLFRGEPTPPEGSAILTLKAEVERLVAKVGRGGEPMEPPASRPEEPEPPRALPEARLPKHVCSLASFVPPGLQWQTSHIILEPASNPKTGERFTDRDGGPVYNQTYEPWQPEAKAAAEAATLRNVTAVAAVGWGLFALAEADNDRHVAALGALEAENRDLRGKLQEKTAVAEANRVVADASVKMIELTQRIERARAEQAIATLQAQVVQVQTQLAEATRSLSMARLVRRRRPLPRPVRDSLERSEDVARRSARWEGPVTAFFERVFKSIERGLRRVRIG